MKEEIDTKTLQELDDILNHNYTNAIFTSMLSDMFGRHDEAIKEYIKPGRGFWYYDAGRGCFRKLTVTYVRSGVMFFVFQDDPNVEHAWFIGSFNSFSLYAAQIYPYEIGKILSQWYENAEKEFPLICKQCKWDELNGRIKVEVVWDNKTE